MESIKNTLTQLLEQAKEVQILRGKNNILSDCYRIKCSTQGINQMKNNCETITK